MSENELLTRIEKLEKKNKIYSSFFIAALVFTLFGFYSNDIYKNIKTENLQLVDSIGTVRAELRMEEGHPSFSLFDEREKVRFVLTQEKEQTGLFILDETGTVRIGTAQFSHGGGGFALHGANAEGAAVLYLKEDGSLTFYDKEGKVSLRIPHKEK